jgi:CxxC-x17-CxxC domain-containing protein
MPYQDQVLTCRDCRKTFVFTAGAQEFFAQKGYTNAPSRCKECNVIRKKSRETTETKPAYKISCKNCGKQSEMATEPRKPDDVLCSECFYQAFRAQHGESITQVEHAHQENEVKQQAE